MSNIIQSNSPRKAKVPSSLILPDDLIAEVLSLLDIKFLMQLKCVCKSWNSLISSDPTFAKMHLIKSSPQNPKHLTMFSCKNKDYSFPSQFITISKDFVLNHYQVKNEDCNLVLGSSNGLICMLSQHIYHNVQNFHLRFWNPATRSVSKIVGCFTNTFMDRYDYFRFSFGCDNTTGKYKVVAFSSVEVRVFTLGDKFWRIIQRFPLLSIRSNNVGYNEWKDLNVTVEQFVIISLDLGTETYTQLLPPRGFNEVPHVMPVVSVLMHCLCFCHYSNGMDFVIWQMTKFRAEESWTKFLKFSCQNVRGRVDDHLLPLYLSENGDTLILLSDQGHVHYNRKDDKVEQREISDDIKRIVAKDYIESLVSTC
ncbi:putative F-box domain-containing protein [Medicago truncatula]|uniref:F-box protein interaction domain protein n=1 Tax=Medicago truncatula TaxID=3880 RepID=A0A072V6V8_MEDTR|nr:F-box/kelch-repeat protein At3g23880 [Medicago truncatula]KEH37799.1 F-box protein interaction domain protein [Medicago truncatula]RHN73875.1 putative F-box domain-containing protein [Medicago truncatula]